MAVVAVGGYGRRELCPHSDVDLLFLHGYKVDRFVESMTEWMLYPLWDLGLEVGHSVRNIKETIRLAGTDDSIRTALLDHRLVTGDDSLYGESTRELDRFLYFQAGDKFIEKKIREMRSRHAKVGSTVYLLEPNVKEGRGGLRDLQTAVWGARIKYKCDDLAELRRKGVLGARTVEAIRHVLDYLLRVRNELHYLQGKKADILGFEVQERLAERFRYQPVGANQAVERFMRSYYLHAASTARLSDEVIEEVGRFLPEEGGRKPFFFLKRKIIGEGGILYKGQLQVKDRASFEKEPIRILEFFRSMQKTKSVLSPQARRNIQLALPAVGAAFREDREAAKLFLEILADPVHLRETLLAMNESRFLARYIPEFAPLYCKVQRDLYHVYTVDIHSIRCASVLAEIETSASRTEEEEEFHRIHATLRNPGLFHLAILFHDIGKGKGQGHSRIGAEIVARIGARWGLAEQDVSDLVFLVEQHLLMANVSQRRDLHDIELILSFADTVGTVSRLDQLYLLTYADMKEVAPEVWTQWKAMLLAELYEKGRNVLDQGALKRPFEERAQRRLQQVREFLAGEPMETVDRFLARVDDRYLLAHSRRPVCGTLPDSRGVRREDAHHRGDRSAGIGDHGVPRRLPRRTRPLREDRGDAVCQQHEHPQRLDRHHRGRRGAGHVLRQLSRKVPAGGTEEGACHRGPFARPHRGDHRGGPHGRPAGGEVRPGPCPPVSAHPCRFRQHGLLALHRGGHLHLRPDRAPLRHHEHAYVAGDRHRALQDLHESGPGGRRLLHRRP